MHYTKGECKPKGQKSTIKKGDMAPTDKAGWSKLTGGATPIRGGSKKGGHKKGY